MVETSASRHCCHGQRQRDRRRRHHTAVTGIVQNAGEEPRSGRRPGVLRIAGMVLLCSMLLPVAEAMAKNEERDSNDLGLLAQACATSYCGVGVTALDLWLSLEEKCDVESTPSLTTKLWASGGSGGVVDAGGNWSVTSTALICACVWSALVYAGFRSGARVGTHVKGGYPVA